MSLEILAVTGTRADWGLLVSVLRAVRRDPDFQLRVAVTGQHLLAGSTSMEEIVQDGFAVNHRVDMELTGDSALSVTQAMGRAVIGFAELIDRARPDLIMLLGDRFEIQAAATAALVARLPIAHISGGDLTEGAIDDAFRHGITKMAHLHFVTNAAAERRVIQLGEDPKTVFNVGNPGLDRIREFDPPARKEFFRSIGLEPQAHNLLITFHPVTLADDSDEQCRAMLDALASITDAGMIFTGSNADPGARAIDAMTRSFAIERPHAVFIPSLGFRRYLAALTHVDAVIGNSSSGLTEASSFGIPTVNIGDRQRGRPQAVSVINCEAQAEAIAAAIRKALALPRMNIENPYGDGHAAEQIIAALKTIKDPASLLKKRFFDDACAKRLSA